MCLGNISILNGTKNTSRMKADLEALNIFEEWHIGNQQKWATYVEAIRQMTDPFQSTA